MTARYLLIGCGYARDRRIDPLAYKQGLGLAPPPRPDFSDGELYTLDANVRCAPDLVADLECYGRWPIEVARTYRSLELLSGADGCLKDDLFDEVHAYEVLEHLGQQGQVESFLGSFEPIYHVLKAGGFLCGTVPSIHSEWRWGDPGHRRIITAGGLGFLDRTHGIAPPSSDYRALNPCDFRLCSSFDNGETLAFILQAVKPAREIV